MRWYTVQAVDLKTNAVWVFNTRATSPEEATNKVENDHNVRVFYVA
jgi:hypothetical protein